MPAYHGQFLKIPVSIPDGLIKLTEDKSIEVTSASWSLDPQSFCIQYLSHQSPSKESSLYKSSAEGFRVFTPKVKNTAPNKSNISKFM